jgi:DNA-binding transcriptional MerR regulator
MSTTYRTGTVARMLRMPVSTLRVWERRYQLTDTPRSPGGQRLYSTADVQRLAVLKQLVDVGHAVGLLAPLALPELQDVLTTHAESLRRATRRPARAVKAATRAPRWSDAELADFAGLSTTVACECPKHLAEILQRLTAFEAYSASCRAQSRGEPAEAALHAELEHLAAQARALFERGLERVARHEGLMR